MASHSNRVGVTQWEAGQVKPHYLLNKDECIKELQAMGSPIPMAGITVPELRTLVKEQRISEGVILPDKRDEFMPQMAKAKSPELLEMCNSRGIPLGKKPTVGEMRLRLRNWYIQQGTNQTVLNIGKFAGKTFQELMIQHPDYVAWAQEEVLHREENADWRLRQLASWSIRMEREPTVKPAKEDAQKVAKMKIENTKMKVDTDSKPSQGYVNVSVEQMEEMQSQMQAMKEELEELQKGRKKAATRTESVSDGSFEQVPQ